VLLRIDNADRSSPNAAHLVPELAGF